MLVPDHGLLGHALTEAGVAHDRARFGDGHYVAMAEVDRARSEPEVVTDYVGAFLRRRRRRARRGARRAGTRARARGAGVEPAAARARAAAARLAAAGLRLAVTSNSNGTVADLLRRHEILQVGAGPGIEVAHISDSGVIGVHKPDAAMFDATAAGLGLPHARICHIGDAGGYDADGAAAAGMVAVHVDPLGLCPADHVHVDSLADFADRLLGVG